MDVGRRVFSLRRTRWGLDIYERSLTALELGRRLGLTNAEREALKLWPFLPIDKTEEELAEQSKARERERRARKRRAKGVRTRKAYLAELARKPKPWITEGISRSAYYRKRKRDKVSRGGETGEFEIIVLMQRTYAVSLKGECKEAFRKVCWLGIPKRTPVGAEQVETKASSSPGLRTNLVSPTEEDARISAFNKKRRAAERIASKSDKHDA